MAQFIHKITRWTKAGLDVYGRPQWAGPYVMKARWEDRTTRYVDVGGTLQQSKCTVYVEKPIALGDYIVKGEFVDTTPPTTAVIVKDFRTIENVLGDRVEHRALT